MVIRHTTITDIGSNETLTKNYLDLGERLQQHADWLKSGAQVRLSLEDRERLLQLCVKPGPQKVRIRLSHEGDSPLVQAAIVPAGENTLAQCGDKRWLNITFDLED